MVMELMNLRSGTMFRAWIESFSIVFSGSYCSIAMKLIMLARNNGIYRDKLNEAINTAAREGLLPLQPGGLRDVTARVPSFEIDGLEIVEHCSKPAVVHLGVEVVEVFLVAPAAVADLVDGVAAFVSRGSAPGMKTRSS
jgi:hypothetical protein